MIYSYNVEETQNEANPFRLVIIEQDDAESIRTVKDIAEGDEKFISKFANSMIHADTEMGHTVECFGKNGQFTMGRFKFWTAYKRSVA